METINIAEKLKGRQKGMRLYSPVFGEVTLEFVDRSDNTIYIETASNETKELDEYGRWFPLGECMLFPSKDCRDWSKFNPVFPPFEIKKMEKGYIYWLSEDMDVLGIHVEYIPIDDNGTPKLDDDELFACGNYFNTREQAEYAAQKVKELLLSLRKEVKDE